MPRLPFVVIAPTLDTDVPGPWALLIPECRLSLARFGPCALDLIGLTRSGLSITLVPSGLASLFTLSKIERAVALTQPTAARRKANRREDRSSTFFLSGPWGCENQYLIGTWGGDQSVEAKGPCGGPELTPAAGATPRTRANLLC